MKEAAQQRASLTLKVALLLAYGLDRFGEEAWQMVHEARLARHTVENAISVVRAYGPEWLSSPRGETNFTILREVAPVYRRDAAEGERLLLEAEREGLTSDEVRGRVKALRGVAEVVPRPQIFTLAELQEDLGGFSCPEFKNNGRKFAVAWLAALAKGERHGLQEKGTDSPRGKAD